MGGVLLSAHLLSTVLSAKLERVEGSAGGPCPAIRSNLQQTTVPGLKTPPPAVELALNSSLANHPGAKEQQNQQETFSFLGGGGKSAPKQRCCLRIQAERSSGGRSLASEGAPAFAKSSERPGTDASRKRKAAFPRLLPRCTRKRATNRRSAPGSERR